MYMHTDDLQEISVIYRNTVSVISRDMISHDMISRRANIYDCSYSTNKIGNNQI